MVVCPSCGSSRIRSDYKPAPLFLRLIGVRGLLCDGCNFPFRAFSPLPPRSRRPRHTQRKADLFNPAPVPSMMGRSVQIQQQSTPPPPIENAEPKPAPSLLEKLESKPTPAAAGKPEIILAQTEKEKTGSPISAQTTPFTASVAPARNDLRTEITRIHAQGAKAASRAAKAQSSSPARQISASSLICPECESRNVKRRRRNFLERSFMFLSEHKAYTCRDCGASFYAKREEGETRKILADQINPASIESSCFNVDQRAGQKG